MTVNAIAASKPGIPLPVAIFTWLLIVAGCFFFYVYSFQPSLVFPDANVEDYSAQLGFGSTGVRILGSVVALLISVLANDARWLFITLISRIFIELGDATLGVMLDGPTANTAALIVLAGAEAWATLVLWRAIRRAKG